MYPVLGQSVGDTRSIVFKPGLDEFQAITHVVIW